MEKPIIFSTPMVRAILEGKKTQTRRVIKPQPSNGIRKSVFVKSGLEDGHGREIKIPYQPGDVLWVRETWADLRGMGFDRPFAYLTDSWNSKYGEEDGDSKRCRLDYGVKWKPSIHMPKSAARIWLEVVNVRAERLQDILCGDMKREGCIPATVTGGQWQQWQRDYWIPLWDSLNAKRGYGWDTNPWVWVVAFEKISKEEAERLKA